MIDACALYFAVDKLPLKDLFPKVYSDKGLFRAATWFEYDTKEGPIRLNLAPAGDLGEHLRGFMGYVAGLPNPPEAIAEAQRLISRTKSSAGVILPRPISPDSETFRTLMNLTARFHGFMFVADSILLPNGTFLVGPMAGGSVEELGEPPLRVVNPDDYRHEGQQEGADPARVAAREQIYRQLGARGFQCARWLPLYRDDDGQDHLRPIEEIAGRLLALHALFLWVASREDVARSARIKAFVDRNQLRQHLTPDEAAILDLNRRTAQQEHVNMIGWRLENMWALSWILGFEPAPPYYIGQLPPEIIDRMLSDFLPGLDATLQGFVSSLSPRAAAEIGYQEDLYYCAHNAVRSAQTGQATVPRSFHPIRDGGAVHERRHALTWALSPETDWDDTDLST